MVSKKTTAKGTRKTANTNTAVKPPLGSGKDSRDISYLPGGTRVSRPRTKTPNSMMATKAITSNNRAMLTGVNLASATPVYPRGTGMTGVNHQSKPKTAKSKKK